MATNDEAKIRRVVREVGEILQGISMETPPPHTGRLIYKRIYEITGNPDPYREVKDQSTKKALSLYPRLKGLVSKSHDRLLTAIRVAIAGNIIDFGTNRSFDMEGEIESALAKDFAVCDYEPLLKALNNSRGILYIGDNAGECVFDRILIETLDLPVTYAVRGAPIINDATLRDARDAGIDKVATLISSGTDAPGAILETCDAAFVQTFRQADLIISKGQGNFEALSDQGRQIFFLLKIKCGVLARDTGLKEGDIVLKGNQCGPATPGRTKPEPL